MSRLRCKRSVVLAAFAVVAVWGAPLRAQQIEASPVSHAAPFAVGQDIGSEGGGGGGGGAVGAPASFSLLPYYVTPVKNQVSCGSCWAFACYGAMESNLLVQGGAQQDFSENHLKNYHGFDLDPCAGGNTWMHTAYLSRLDGPVSEADDPYHGWDDRPSPGGPRQAFLRRSVYRRTPGDIKDAVTNRGALYTHMCWDQASYNSAAYTYLYTGGDSVNHAVAIVGWDDNKAVPGAGAAGAWEARNSWGAGFGDGGYFWISYEDTKACKFAASFESEQADVAQRCYSYDYYGDVNEVNCPYAYNRFTATEDEKLAAVGFYVGEDNATYTVEIYDTVDENDLPIDLLASKTGSLLEGFHAVDLDSLVEIDAGDDFIVSLHIEDGGEWPLAFDWAEIGYSSGCTANPGESFYSFDGVGWTDLTTFDNTANFCIKAYTIPEPVTLLLLGLGGLGVLVRRRR